VKNGENMNRLYLFGIVIFITFINLGCNDGYKSHSFSFNADWQFVRFDQDFDREIKTMNQGAEWSSQYDISHVSSNNILSIPKKVLKMEFYKLKNVVWENVSLPHTPKVENLTVLHQWQGICFYKKKFIVDENLKDKICYIEFEGAMHLADVWINGKHAIQHAGGYTPFVIDLSDYLKFGEQNEVLVRLDNRNNPIIPPGKPLEKLDFCYYGGIYRDVNFLVKEKIHITHPLLADKVAGGGVFVTYPEVSENKAEISVKTHIANETDGKTDISVRQSLIVINGHFNKRTMGRKVKVIETEEVLSAGEEKHVKQIIEITNPKLWSPDQPNLYLLKTEILKSNSIVDREERRIGIRRLDFSLKNGFRINGKKVRLVGTNRHQEYPYIGNAIPDSAQYRDIYHIKESGFNIVRLGHYIQDKSVLDACDELGVMAIEPIPGWQFFNKNNNFCELTYRDIRYMIRRDRNHPSVIMWEVILNESWPPAEWKDIAAKTAHEEYPGDQCFTSGDSYNYFGWDVQYNDWEEGFNRPNNSKKPGFIREYYDYEFGGHYSTTRVKRGDGEKALLQNAWNAQWSHNRYRSYYPWTTGDAVWSMYDYNRGCCDNICRSGVSDIFRINKFSVPFFKSQIEVSKQLPSGEFGPYIFIANYWDNQPDDNKVVVYANVDEVSLVINGREIERKRCDNGQDSEYADSKEMWYKGGNPFDGGNCLNLEKPPFTFNNVKWEKGKIKAVGYIKGAVVAEQFVITPEKPYKLFINYFESGKPALTEDLIIVNVSIKDKNGVLCVNDQTKISLSVIKGGSVVGPTIVNSEAGISSFLVKTFKSENLILEAKSEFSKSIRSLKLVRDFGGNIWKY